MEDRVESSHPAEPVEPFVVRNSGMLDPSILAGKTVNADADRGSARDAVELDARLQQADLGLRMLATLVELLSALDAHANLRRAAGEVARLIEETLSANRVLIYWRRDSTSNLSLVADPASTRDVGQPDFDRLALAAAEETIVRPDCCLWKDDASLSDSPVPCDRDGLLAVRQFAKAMGLDTVVGVPLQCLGEDARGVMLVLGADCDGFEAFLDTVRDPVTHKLVSIEASEPTWLEQRVRAGTEILKGPKRRWIAIGTSVVLMLCLIPVPYRIPAAIELQPNQRRYVAVPFDGPLKSSLVRPGDLVQIGDLLAEIDPRELEYELSGINAELQQSLQEKKGLMAERNVAGSQIADLNSQRLQSEADLLLHRRENLEIRSPIAGVVVSGDLEKSRGMPMTRGDTLFEIAPLEVMQVDIAIPETEVQYVRIGMEVDLFLDALPGRALKGKVNWIHPRAELIDNENVFIARMELANPDLLYRPGMHGRARIQGDRYPVVWNYLHKPFYALRRFVGW